MTFDNGKTIIALRLRVFLATVLVLVYIYFAFLGKELKFPVLGIESSGWTLIIFGLYALISFYPLLLNYKYIYFSDDGPDLVFRFYRVGLFSGKKSSVEVPKSEFAGYKVDSYKLVFKMIRLSRKIDRKVATYPPIHLGSLKKKEINKIVASLDSFSIPN